MCGAEGADQREGSREVSTPGTEGFQIFSIGLHWASGMTMPHSIKPTERKPVTSTVHLVWRKVKMRQYSIKRATLISPLVIG